MNNVMISVVMAVYNGEKYVREAVDSIINQTYRNWEMIIVNDASTDATAEILENYTQQDLRIKVLTNKVNKRLPASLNYGIQEAKGKYILRMDADDICSKARFERQIAYMEKHEDIALSWGLGFSYCNDQIQNSVISYSVKYEKLKALLLFFNPVYHNCVIMRRDLFETFAYQPECTISEDWKLWTQIIQKEKMQGVRDYYALYRTHDEQASSIKNRDVQEKQVKRIIVDMLENIGFQMNEAEITYQIELIFGTQKIDGRRFLDWAKRLQEQNRACGWCKVSDLQYGLMWKLDDLYRNARISRESYCKLSCKISTWSFFCYWVRKLLTASADVFYRQAGKRKFF